MLKIENLFLFFFTWSCLVVIRSLFLTLGSMFAKEPKPIKMTKLELLLTSVTISYIITYLIVK
jgi:hypothetical protein